VQRDSRTGECPQDDEDRRHAEGRGVLRVAKDHLGEDDRHREADYATSDSADWEVSRHRDAAHDAMRRADRSDMQISSECDNFAARACRLMRLELTERAEEAFAAFRR